MADSKLSLVLVDGSKNRVARILFLQTSLYLDLSFYVLCPLDEAVYFLGGKVENIYQISHFLPSFHRKDCRGIL